MKFPRSKFAVYCVLVSSWLAFCATSCDEGEFESKYTASICAQKPAGVDSLNLQVTYQAGDSVWADSNSTVSEYGSFNRRNMACVSCIWKCDSLFSISRTNKVSVNLSFYCGGKEIALPTYAIDGQSHRWGEDDIDYRFVELDERKINGDFVVESFLPPDDTSCGKFVNYAVLRLP